MTDGDSGAVRKRSVMIAGHRTSVSLEAAFWEALQEIARARNSSVQAVIAQIDSQRTGNNLSSAIRVYVLENLQKAVRRATED